MSSYNFSDVAIPIEAPRRGTVELIPGLLPQKGQLVISGETESGKSLICLEIAASLLTGAPLWGHLHVTHIHKVIYVLGEHYAGTLQGLWERTQLTCPPESLWIIGPDTFPDHALIAAGHPRDDIIQRLVTWVEGAQLVIFDPLAAFARGMDAENDNTTMRALVDTMTYIARRVGAACLVPAHSGKSTIIEGGREIRRGSYQIRGASAIEDAATNIFYLERLEEDNLWRLKRRKYKGAAPDFYYLYRDPHTLRHTLLDSKRPVQDMHRIEHLNQFQRFQQVTDLPFAQAKQKYSYIFDVPLRTLENWLLKASPPATASAVVSDLPG